MFVIKAGINKMLVRIFNRQTQSDLGLHCLSRPFWQATSVKNFSLKFDWQEKQC